jgi:putative DNA primase/helicase
MHDGDVDDSTVYAAHCGDTSRADMAFVKHLDFWWKGDEQLMDKCFRASCRMRQKWDEYRGSQTYAEMIMRKAYGGIPSMESTSDSVICFVRKLINK